jgi:hypothetical protein
MTMTGATTPRRIVATFTALLAITTAFVAGFLVSDARSRVSEPAYRLTAAGLYNGLSCDRLRQWYVDHGLDQVTAWGWQAPMYRMVTPMAGGIPEDATGSAPNASLDTQTGSSTGTNVQEAGVDEPDLVKTTGGLLVRISDGSLKTDDVSGAVPRRLGVVPLDRMGNPQLLLSGDRAVVIGSEVEDPAAGATLFPVAARTRVLTYDLADPSDPTLVDTRVYDGSLVTARQVGSVVRLVLDGGLPSLHFTQPSSTVTEKQSLEHNRQVVRDSTVSDWLPQVTTYNGGQESSASVVDCSRVAVPETFNGLGTLAVVGFDPADPAAVDTSAVATGSDTAYMSPTHLYVAMSPWLRIWQGFGPAIMPTDGAQSTRIYGFDLSGTSARYVGMGSLGGTVAGSWSMDEHDGVLRVAASSGGGTSVVTFRPASGRLLDVGHLDGLAVGQQLKSVRWFDDLAVLVTFRQVDPFYVVDVADATDPRVVGSLHLPGWSSYLHPVGPHLVLGLGQTSPPEMMIEAPEAMPTMPPVPVPSKPAPQSGSSGRGGPVVATPGPVPVDPPQPIVPMQRAKATLFDISDLAHPRDVDTVSYPDGSVAMAGMEPHQVTWLPDRGVLLTVIGSGYAGATQGGDRAWVSVLTVHAGSLDSRLLPVPPGSRVEDVRTVPLADGRVVLVAGDSVLFLTV